MGRKKKTKRRVFMRCYMNSLTLVDFIWPRRMATKMDSITNRFNYHCWMANKMGLSPPLDLVIAIRFDCFHRMETGKGGIRQIPFSFFRSPTRMGDLKKYGYHSTATISHVELLKNGSCHTFLKTF
jgi:hypothetical protein